MDKQEIEITRAVIDLANKILEDKHQERFASTKKAFYQMLVTIVIVICFAIMWLYEIHESYSYADMSIENKAIAKIESEG